MIRRPVIAPGLPVLTAPGGTVQVGLTAGHRIRVPDTPAVRRALAVLARGEALPAGHGAVGARSLLDPVLRDGDVLGRPGISAADAAAVTLQHPGSAADRLEARARERLGVVGDLGVDFSALLDAVGLPTRSGEEPGEPATVVLAVGRGEPERAPFDALVRDGTPHVVVRAVESEVVVGPFVVPGRTACLRCCDLHRSEDDPGFTACLRDAARSRRSDGVPEPLDTALAWIALGWAVRDLVRYAEGDRPVTWSSTVRLDGPGEVPVVRRWTPHPDCSCTWTARD